MVAKYTDAEIASLINERKPLPENYRDRLALRDKQGHKERDMDILGAQGSNFRLILRQSKINVIDFSIILAVYPPESNQLFRLRRYNGKSHVHTTHIEGNTFYNFHIHMATERYQDRGTDEDAYAEESDQFSDFNSALSCMFDDCSFDFPIDSQPKLFDRV